MLDHVDELKAHFASLRPTGRRRRRDPIDALSVIGPNAEVLKPAQDAV
jgi:hypothetical protein